VIKAAIETAHAELKTAFEAKNGDDVKAKTEALDAAWMAASEELYAAGQGAQGADAGAQNPGGNNAGGEDVQDADFEEVK
jgi:molecular chaperone DnaK